MKFQLAFSMSRDVSNRNFYFALDEIKVYDHPCGKFIFHRSTTSLNLNMVSTVLYRLLSVYECSSYSTYHSFGICYSTVTLILFLHFYSQLV